tara:strand:+ start:995 stop:1177 length:183 start_codon:yes stop_codon:yes gene_type:complete
MTSTTVKIPSNAGTRAVLYNKNQTLKATNEGLSRRVKNLEQEVTVLFAITAGLATAAILF